MTVILIRTIIIYAIMIFSIKMMGKRQISDLQTSELVITIMISNIATLPMEDPAEPLVSSLLPIIILICCEITVSCLMLKSRKIREIVCGKPVVVIKKGEIQQKAMKYLRLSTQDLIEQLRQLDIFDINDVWYAIMETNGQMSVLKKSESQPPCAKDTGLRLPNPKINAVIISDGVISEESMKFCGIDADWLDKTLKEKNIERKDVFLMTTNESKEFKIIKKEIST